MAKEKKPHGCAIGCLSILVLSVILAISLYGCSDNNSNNDTETTDNDTTTATEDFDLQSYISKVQSLNYQLYDKFSLDTVSNEDKVAEANRIEELIAPDFELLRERNQQDNDNGGDFDYSELQVYNAFGALRAECNAIREYIDTGSPEKLDDVNKYHQAVLDDIQKANELLNE